MWDLTPSFFTAPAIEKSPFQYHERNCHSRYNRSPHPNKPAIRYHWFPIGPINLSAP